MDKSQETPHFAGETIRRSDGVRVYGLYRNAAAAFTEEKTMRPAKHNFFLYAYTTYYPYTRTDIYLLILGWDKYSFPHQIMYTHNFPQE